MLRAALGLALALVAPAHAGTILYATAATTGGNPGQIGVSGYCVDARGGLDVNPVVEVPTAGSAPSRLLALITPSNKQFLYVAENDRVQVFEIGTTGRLNPVGRIPAQPVSTDPNLGLAGMNPHDIKIALSPDGSRQVLYVPQRSQDRIAAFPLDPDTGLSTVPTRGFRCTGGDQDGMPCDPTDPSVCTGGACLEQPISDQSGSSCVLGPVPSEWEDLIVANGLVYASRSLFQGDVRVYRLEADGNFADGVFVFEGVSYPVDSSDCDQPIDITNDEGEVTSTRRGVLEPYSRRRRLNGSGPMVLMDDILYVSERFRRAISAFELCPGNGFTPECTTADDDANGVPDDPCPAGGFFLQPKLRERGICAGPGSNACSDIPRGVDCRCDVDSDCQSGTCIFCTNRFRQPRLAKRGGRTFSDIRYNDIVLAEGAGGRTILGSQFRDGRVDGYRLKDDGRLPRATTRRTTRDFRTSPFRVFVHRPAEMNSQESAGVLYVGTGNADRVEAYRLDASGLPSDKSPFSSTTVLTNTFPNAVIVVETPGPCR